MSTTDSEYKKAPFHEWYRKLNKKVIHDITIDESAAKQVGLEPEEKSQEYYLRLLDLKVSEIMVVYLEHYKKFTAMLKLSDQELRIKNCNERINFEQDPKIAEIWAEITDKFRAEELILYRRLKENQYLNPKSLKTITDTFDLDNRTFWDLVTRMKRLDDHCGLIPRWAWDSFDDWIWESR